MLRPEKAEYFYNRGNCYNKIGETQKALLDYSMAIRIDNKTATYYEHRYAPEANTVNLHLSGMAGVECVVEGREHA